MSNSKREVEGKLIIVIEMLRWMIYCSQNRIQDQSRHFLCFFENMAISLVVLPRLWDPEYASENSPFAVLISVGDTSHSRRTLKKDRFESESLVKSKVVDHRSMEKHKRLSRPTFSILLLPSKKLRIGVLTSYDGWTLPTHLPISTRTNIVPRQLSSDHITTHRKCYSI